MMMLHCMTHYRILDKDIPLYYSDEELRIEVDFNYEKSLKDILFRRSFINENGECVGTSWSEQFDLEGEGSQKAQIRFPLSSLVIGNYLISIAFCYKRKDGYNDTLDIIGNISKIEIQQRPEKKTLIWYPKYWGVKLPDNHFQLTELR